MSAQADRSHTAQIVDMVRLLETSASRRYASTDDQRGSAVLLSIRQNLRFQASIGLDDSNSLQSLYLKQQLDELHQQVRQLLDAEFGRLRVHRNRQAFSVGHYNLEGLIAGLLRVQYHARQIQLPEPVGCDDQFMQPKVSLCWGVGATALDADNERARRRRSRR